MGAVLVSGCLSWSDARRASRVEIPAVNPVPSHRQARQPRQPRELAPRLPERIVCLTEESTETLYLLGEQRRIVGISGFTVRPPQARREKPRVSAFTSANIDRIVALRPDLVLGFSDLQADIARELIGRGIEVWISNQRSVAEILGYVLRLGAMVGAPRRAQRLVAGWQAGFERLRRQAAAWPRRPRVYFEEWDQPMICGIRWVSELIALAGGDDVFADLAEGALGAQRIIADADEVPRRAPEIIVGSWCGKKFQPARVAARPGWQDIPAVRGGQLHEIKSPLILQPGPAALSDGVHALAAIFAQWQHSHPV